MAQVRPVRRSRPAAFRPPRTSARRPAPPPASCRCASTSRPGFTPTRTRTACPTRPARPSSRALGQAHLYPSNGELRRLIAEREGLTPDHVLIGAGSSEVLRMAGDRLRPARQRIPGLLSDVRGHGPPVPGLRCAPASGARRRRPAGRPRRPRTAHDAGRPARLHLQPRQPDRPRRARRRVAPPSARPSRPARRCSSTRPTMISPWSRPTPRWPRWCVRGTT